MAIAKCVGMGPFDNPISPGSSYADLRYPGVQGYFTDTGTGWVRFFAEWNYWEPGTTSNTQSTAYLTQQSVTDANIMIAKSLGLGVILCTRGFPQFANGTTDPFQFPSLSNLGPTGPYAQWAFYLMDRYHPVNRLLAPILGALAGTDPCHRWIDFLEVVNEPNYECHPASAAAASTAAMFSTCHGIANYLNAVKDVGGRLTGARPLRLLGPASADTTTTSSSHIAYDTFTSDLLAALQSGRFNLSSRIFGWSHHNYSDVASQMPLAAATTANPSTGNRAQLVRQLLTGTWGGYGSPSVQEPGLYLTEGGYVRPANTIDSSSEDAIQSSDLTVAIQRLTGSTAPGEPGDGIQMFTNFLFDTDASFDSGLLGLATTAAPEPAPRPAYTTWKTAF